MLTTCEAALEVSRCVAAPPRDVHRAWVDAELLAKWFRPGPGLTVQKVACDARAGGELRIEAAVDGGGTAIIAGRFEEVVEGERLTFACRIEMPEHRGQGWPRPESRVQVELEPTYAGTRVLLRQEKLPHAEARALLGAMWTNALGFLPEVFRDAFVRSVTQAPTYRSRFGGLWPDRSDALDVLEGRRRLGWLRERDVELFRNWIDHGYVVLPGAVPRRRVDALRTDVERTWKRPPEGLFVEHVVEGALMYAPMRPELRDGPHKVLDLHAFSKAARRALFSAPVQDFLEKLFERPPLAFQSLLFEYGSEQALHQDTAFVPLSSPMELVGCWLALEDVRPGSGELQYYAGSHRIEEHVWPGGSRAKPHDDWDMSGFLRWVQERPRELGLALVRHRPRKGDVLLWHADLVHGGAERVDRSLTRRSLVTHFCPANVTPVYAEPERMSPIREHGSASLYRHLRRG